MVSVKDERQLERRETSFISIRVITLETLSNSTILRNDLTVNTVVRNYRGININSIVFRDGKQNTI